MCDLRKGLQCGEIMVLRIDVCLYWGHMYLCPIVESFIELIDKFDDFEMCFDCMIVFIEFKAGFFEWDEYA